MSTRTAHEACPDSDTARSNGILAYLGDKLSAMGKFIYVSHAENI